MKPFCMAAMLLASGLALAGGCSGPSPDAGEEDGGRAGSEGGVLVFGAASTTQALGEACAAFETKEGGRVATSFASSSALAQQIIHGARADLFLSANVAWADAVEKKGLVAERVDLLGNRLVLIAPAGSALAAKTMDDLPSAPIRRLALGDPASVPAGIYARQSLENLGLWKVLAPKVVAAADVRQALVYVEQGAAEAGIVYATDAAITDRVRVALTIPETAHDPIVYPLLLTKSAEGNPAARRLYGYLRSAAAVFETYGFTVRADHAKAAP